MTYEKSCGTIIIHDGKVLLVQQKSGFFGFPKGHMEEDETEVETAIRETKEETSLDVLVDEKLRFSLSYIQRGTINKEVVYYIAKPINEIHFRAQEKEIQNIVWMDIDQVEDTLSFDNLKEVWKKVLFELQKQKFSF